MIDAISFKGSLHLAPKVEQAIREKEVFSLLKTFKELPEDVFVSNRKVINSQGSKVETLFDCITANTKKAMPQLVSYEK